MSLFPIFVKLERRAVLVVGGGALAEIKVTQLLEAGAKVLVVAPKVSDAIRRFASERQIEWHERAFVASDVASVDVVFAATGKSGVDRTVAAVARQARVLVNAVDDPDYCDFYMPAIVRRGDLQIAISTNGKSPALAQQLRELLEQQFDGKWAERLEEIGERRREIIASLPAGAARTAELQQLAREAVKELLR